MLESLIFVCAILLVGSCLISNHLAKKLELATDQLQSAIDRSSNLEWALVDVVHSFGEKDVVMHRSTFQKLASLSRARHVLKGNQYVSAENWPSESATQKGVIFNDKV